MDIKKKYQLYQLGEWAYKKAYRLYQPIYFSWKAREDRSKIKFLRNHVKPGMRVVDIGANIGFYTTLFLDMVGEQGSVHSFEPDKLNFKHLTSNTARFKNSFTNNAAVSDKSGKIKLYRFSLNVEFKTYDMGESTDFSEIDCVSLDDYFKNGETVDVLKTDTEGYDYFVIKGMKEVLKRSENIVLITEFWPWGLNKAGISPEEFIAQLKEMGFVLTFTDSEPKRPYEQLINDKFYYTDIIASKQPVSIK